MNNPDKIFKALSDETRLKIMLLLTAGEICVCDLERILETTQTKISRHLSILKYNRLVNSRRQGQWVYYSLPEFDDEFTRLVVKSLDLVKKYYFEDMALLLNNLSKCNSKTGVCNA